ncbi:fimbria/pilus outer membrane usher protein [Yersinia intermedia]|nr:fimbria/pilus outer membrane usher protein [Yersinia intermedia]
MNGNVRTDSRGYAVVPYLSNYQNNNISLNPATLPDNVDMAKSSLNVYPTKGAVVMAKFDTRVGYQALVTLRRGKATFRLGHW